MKTKLKNSIFATSLILNLLVAAIIIFMTTEQFMKLVVAKFMAPVHERWVSQFDDYPAVEKDIVFLGDSITEGANWHEFFPTVTVRNRGIGGDTTTGVLARLSQITKGHPAKVFLLIGTNDLGLGNSKADVLAGIDSIVDTIHKQSPNTKIYVQSILPRDSDYQHEIEDINDNLQKTLRDRAEWIDLYPLFVDANDGSIRDDLSNDELHLLGKGYQLWRNHIARHVTTP